MQQVVIIGNGIAGITAARHIRKQDSTARVVIISSESAYFFSRTALMYVFMGHLKFEHTQPYESFFWKKNRLELICDHVSAIDPEKKEVRLQNSTLSFDKLIIATGSVSNMPGIANENLPGVQSLYSKQDLEALFENTQSTRKAVIVGGGLIGVELAEMLLSRKIETHFIVRDEFYWGNTLPASNAQLIMDHFSEHEHLHMHYGEELESIHGNTRVEGIGLASGKSIDCDLLCLAIGVSPNKKLAEQAGIETDKGILTDEYLQTSAADIYAIGDCVQVRDPAPGRKSIEAVWYAGRMMGETLAQTICGTPTAYRPGPWFNSAKFFDVEYQTYGYVPAETKVGLSVFTWRHPEEYILLHFTFDQDTRTFRGVNAFGMRLRHELMDQWLREKRSIDYVLEHLRTANFDPELYKSYEEMIIRSFNEQTNGNLRLAKRRWWRELLTEKATRIS